MAAAPETATSMLGTATTDASFDSYGRLLRMLMPTLRGVVVHDGFANLVWASDELDLADEPEIVKDAISNALADTAEFAGIMRTLDADRVVYSFAVRGEHIDLLGIVSLIGRPSGTQTEGRPIKYVRQLVQPALECLRRELSLRSQLGSREMDLGGRERDLSLMLEMSSHQLAAASDADEFELILKTGLEHMHCGRSTSMYWLRRSDAGDQG